MRLVLLALSLTVLCAIFVESGRIVRAWRRRPERVGRMVTGEFRPLLRRSSHPASPWNYYRIPRAAHHQHGMMPPRMRGREELQRFRGTQLERGQVEHHGYPIQRDPTTAYVPPPEDELNLGSGGGRRSTGGHVRRHRPWRRPPPPVTHISIWKLLSMPGRRRFPPPHPHPRRPPFKQMPPHPRPHHPPHYILSEEAEIAPNIPNIVYFLPKDTMTPRENVTERPLATSSKVDGLKPGYVSDVPLYPTQATSASEFKPVTSRDYLMKVVEVRRPTLLKPASTTVSSDTDPSPDQESDSAESLLHELLQEPPSPINSFNINIDPSAEGSESFIKIAPSSFVNTGPVFPPVSSTSKSTLPPPSKSAPPPPSRTYPATPRSPPPTSELAATTTTTVRPPPPITARSTTTTTSSTTFKPMFAVRVIMPPADPSSSSTKEAKTSKETNSVEESAVSSSSSVVTSRSTEINKEVSISNSKDQSERSNPHSTSKEVTSLNEDSSSTGNTKGSFNSKEIKAVPGVNNYIQKSTFDLQSSKSVVVSGKKSPPPIEQDENVGIEMESKPTKVTKPTQKPAPAYRWPTMKPSIKSTKKPIVSAKISSSASKTSSTNNSTDSSEWPNIQVTGIRSKVKEYKPVLGTAPGLLLFDKVDTSAEAASKGGASVPSSTSSPTAASKAVVSEDAGSAPAPTSSTTTVSPMQNFDPMKMIHSWLTKAKPKQ